MYVTEVSETEATTANITTGVIPANTPVILKGDEGTYYLPILYNNDATLGDVKNLLQGCLDDTYVSDLPTKEQVWTLQVIEGNVQFARFKYRKGESAIFESVYN